MRHYSSKEGINFPVKVNSHKENNILKRQLIVYFSRIDRDFGINFDNSNISVQFGYVDDDFPKGKYTLLLTFNKKRRA